MFKLRRGGGAANAPRIDHLHLRRWWWDNNLEGPGYHTWTVEGIYQEICTARHAVEVANGFEGNGDSQLVSTPSVDVESDQYTPDMPTLWADRVSDINAPEGWKLDHICTSRAILNGLVCPDIVGRGYPEINPDDYPGAFG